MKKLLFLLVCVAPICLASCASNQGGATVSASAGGTKSKKSGVSKQVPDHEPKIDFWQNGGGACCPYHAQLYQEQALAGRGKRGA